MKTHGYHPVYAAAPLPSKPAFILRFPKMYICSSNPVGKIVRCGLWEEFRELVTVPGNLEATAVD